MSRLLAFLAVLAFAPAALGQPTLLQQLDSPTPSPDSRFGAATDLSGDFIVVGEPGDLGAVGRAYVFFRGSGEATWDLDAELIASSLEEGGEFDPAFGSSVAFDGPNALIGAPYESGEVINSGSAYLFRRDEETQMWVDFAKFKAPEPALEDQFGFSVALFGATAAVGAITDDDAGENAGAVHLFEQDFESGAWIFDQTVTAGDAVAEDRFGFAVALGEDLLAVGVPLEASSTNAGAVYLFEREDDDAPWTQVQKLTPDDGEPGDNFGFSVSVSTTTLFVGAPLAGPNQQGSVYVYERTGSGGAPWELTQSLISDTPQENAQFGADVSVDADLALIGAPLDGTKSSEGAAHSFERQNDLWTPTGRVRVESGDDDARFGLTVALKSGVSVVGAPGNDGTAQNQGALYIYALLPTDSDDEAGAPAFALDGAFPNPAHAETTLSYSLSAATDVSLVAYDLLGREVAVLDRGTRPAGPHTARWTTDRLPAGLYLVRLSTDDGTATRKVTLAR